MSVFVSTCFYLFLHVSTISIRFYKYFSQTRVQLTSVDPVNPQLFLPRICANPVEDPILDIAIQDAPAGSMMPVAAGGELGKTLFVGPQDRETPENVRMMLVERKLTLLSRKNIT